MYLVVEKGYPSALKEGAFEVSVGCAEGRGRSRVLSVVAAEKQASAAEGTKVDCELR
jgi:hypothetical protein